MDDLRFALFGAGFWARVQLAAWGEVPGARCVAVYNRTRSKAEELASAFGVPAVYDDPEALFDSEHVDFVDIVTDVASHARFVQLAASRGVAVICQKPMATSLDEAVGMVAACREANVPFYVHENWRWQKPIREFQRVLASGVVGTPFRARVDFISGFPVFANQPFLRELEQFILTDIGTHILDVARFLFGETSTLYCQTHRIHTDIRGEDCATVMMRMGQTGTTVVCSMAYAENYLERDRFPETYLFVEGSEGSLELAPDYWVRVTTVDGTSSRRVPPTRYEWANPAYEVVQSSIVPCHTNLLSGIKGTGIAETTGEDNLKTLRLVFAAYDSAERDAVISL
jgi:predicted dehydrogenase